MIKNSFKKLHSAERKSCLSVCAYNSNACLGLGMKVEESEEKLKPAIAKMFSIMHKSVSEYSQRMLDELKRHNYVTPTVGRVEETQLCHSHQLPRTRIWI